MPERSKGADLRSAGHLSAWVRTPLQAHMSQWPNGQGVGFRSRRLWVRVPSGSVLFSAIQYSCCPLLTRTRLHMMRNGLILDSVERIAVWGTAWRAVAALNRLNIIELFSDAFSHLYKRVCRSVHHTRGIILRDEIPVISFLKAMKNYRIFPEQSPR